jgi:hypothetical protein
MPLRTQRTRPEVLKCTNTTSTEPRYPEIVPTELFVSFYSQLCEYAGTRLGCIVSRLWSLGIDEEHKIKSVACPADRAQQHT